jgi:surface antigen
MAPWTRSIGGDAFAMAAGAAKLGFRVDQKPGNGAVIVYPPSYGRHINATYGHVALLVDVRPDAAGKILIKDSNGICGGNRRQCRVRMPLWKLVLIIHPK